jgi:hypothetical protein
MFKLDLAIPFVRTFIWGYYAFRGRQLGFQPAGPVRGFYSVKSARLPVRRGHFPRALAPVT